MLFDRRYRRSSGQKRAGRRNKILLIGLVGFFLLIGIPLLAHYGPLPNSLNYWHSLSSAVTDINGNIRWPWSKPRASLMPAETVSATPQPTSFSAFDDTLPNEPANSEELFTAVSSDSGILNEKSPQQCHLEISVSSDLRKVDVIEQLTYRNQTDRTLSDLVLIFQGAQIASTPDAPFSRVIVDGLIPQQDYSYDKTTKALRISLDKSLLPGSETRITLAYALTIPDGAGTASLSPGSLRLASFYAYPAYHQGGAWLTNVSSSLPTLDLDVNITAPNDALVLGSGSTVQKTNLTTENRTQYRNESARDFAFAVDKNTLSEERVIIGEISANTYSEGSATVIRVNELTNAILQHYGGRFGSLANNITLISANLGKPYDVTNPLIFFDKTTFADSNEFRYQVARSLAELYFPKNSSYDSASAAFNDLLTHQLAAQYVITSQGASQSDFTYSHCPEARDLTNLIGNAELGSFDSAITAYRMSSQSQNFDVNKLYGTLDVESAAALKRIVDSYASRMASGAPAPSLSPLGLDALPGAITPTPYSQGSSGSSSQGSSSRSIDEAPGLPAVGSAAPESNNAIDLPDDPDELPPGIDSLD